MKIKIEDIIWMSMIIGSSLLLCACNPYRSTMTHCRPALQNSKVLIKQYVPETAQPQKSDTIDMIDSSLSAIDEATKGTL